MMFYIMMFYCTASSACAFLYPSHFKDLEVFHRISLSSQLPSWDKYFLHSLSLLSSLDLFCTLLAIPQYI